MAIVSDFKVLKGDGAVKIGDGSIIWKKSFDIPELQASQPAILMFMVKGLTVTNTNPAVFINNVEVGKINRSKGDDPNHWSSQIINIGANKLKKHDNEIRISAVSYPNSPPDDNFDDFFVKDVVCFYKQNA